jgi:hypothetical protein
MALKTGDSVRLLTNPSAFGIVSPPLGKKKAVCGDLVHVQFYDNRRGFILKALLVKVKKNERN